MEENGPNSTFSLPYREPPKGSTPLGGPNDKMEIKGIGGKQIKGTGLEEKLGVFLCYPILKDNGDMHTCLN